MNKESYPCNLTDAQWEELAPLLPPGKPGGRSRTVDMPQVINGFLYVLRRGCLWRMMPTTSRVGAWKHPVLEDGLKRTIDRYVSQEIDAEV